MEEQGREVGLCDKIAAIGTIAAFPVFHYITKLYVKN